MTILRPGEHADELISASLTGDLTYLEQMALEQHLTHCSRCRDTLDAFREERRLISGMRHQQPPADLSARVRAGIESGASGELAWWQRRSTLVAVVGSLGAVAAGLLAVVILSDLQQPPVASATDTPLATAEVSISQEPSPTTPPVSNEPTPSVAPDTTPIPAPSVDPNPVGTLRYTIRDQRPTLEVVTAEQSQEPVATELDVEQQGLPIDSALSPDGAWLAFRVLGDATGLVDTYAYRLEDPKLVVLAEDSLDSPFSRLAWSPDSQFLAYSVGGGDGEQGTTWDTFVFYPQADEQPHQLTDNGSAFAAGFPSSDSLWVSVAGTDPVTYDVPIPTEPITSPVDLASAAGTSYQGAFLPVREPVDPPGAAVVWHGQMSKDSGDWGFSRGGMLYLVVPDESGALDDLASTDRQVFDVTMPGGEAFASARLAWAPDGEGLAVWDAQWTGTQQGGGFPDYERVYFAHAGSDFKIGPAQALDKADTTGLRVVQVSLAGGNYLALTILTAEGSEGGSFGPTAELRVVKRNFGDVPDEVEVSGEDNVWNGPAFYRPVLDPEGDGE